MADVRRVVLFLGFDLLLTWPKATLGRSRAVDYGAVDPCALLASPTAGFCGPLLVGLIARAVALFLLLTTRRSSIVRACERQRWAVAPQPGW